MQDNRNLAAMANRRPPNAGKGRPKGSLNKSTVVLKDAILQAAENAGNGDIVAYLTKLADSNPASFATLLGKVLPMQVEGKTEHYFLSHEDALALLDEDS